MYNLFLSTMDLSKFATKEIYNKEIGNYKPDRI